MSKGNISTQKITGYVEAIVHVPLYEHDLKELGNWLTYQEPGIEKGNIVRCIREVKLVSQKWIERTV